MADEGSLKLSDLPEDKQVEFAIWLSQQDGNLELSEQELFLTWLSMQKDDEIHEGESELSELSEDEDEDEDFARWLSLQNDDDNDGGNQEMSKLSEDQKNKFQRWLSLQKNTQSYLEFSTLSQDQQEAYRRWLYQHKDDTVNPGDPQRNFALWRSLQNNDEGKPEVSKLLKDRQEESVRSLYSQKDDQDNSDVSKLPEDLQEEFAVWLSLYDDDTTDQAGLLRRFLRMQIKRVVKEPIASTFRKNEDSLQRKRKASPALEGCIKTQSPPQPNISQIAQSLPTSLPVGSCAPGAFPKSTVKKTWAFGYDRADDIKIEEVLQKQFLQQVVLCAFTMDFDWIAAKLDLARNQWLPLVAISHWEDKNLESLVPHRVMTGPEEVSNIMHAKFMILFYPGWIRLVIMTANLRGWDWGEQGGIVENTVFLIDLPLCTSYHDPDELLRMPTKFQNDFTEFVSMMRTPPHVIEKLDAYDWSATKDLIFVHSEGRNTRGRRMASVGISGLGAKLQAAGFSYNGDIQVDYAASTVGVLTTDLLAEMYSAFQGKEVSADKKSKAEIDQVKENVRIYYPSTSTVLASKGGRNAAKTFGWYPKNLFGASNFIKGMAHDYKSVRKGCLSHNKLVFVQPKDKAIKGRPWVYIGSANLTRSAWGSMKRSLGGTEWLEGENWECGVIIPLEEKVGEAGARNLDAFRGVVPVPMHVDVEALSEGNMPYQEA